MGPRRQEHVISTERAESDDVAVLIVDDQAPFRAVAATVVRLAEGFRVVGEAASGEEALESVAALEPDIVLMDINLGGMSGIEATRTIREGPDAPVVILLSTYAASDLPADATDCGASAYVHKEDFGPAVIREVWDGRER